MYPIVLLRRNGKSVMNRVVYYHLLAAPGHQRAHQIHLGMVHPGLGQPPSHSLVLLRLGRDAKKMAVELFPSRDRTSR